MNIDLRKLDSEMREVKVYAYDSSGYRRVVEKNAKVAGVKINLEETDTDCAVKYSKGKAEIKDLKKERKIKHGKEILKVITLKK